MRTITLNTIKVTQPIGELFITKIDQATLWEMSKVDRRHITNDDEVIGVQRELKADKIRQIKKYLTTINATFPNSIILNVNRENLVEESETKLTLMVKEDTFTIIDGQHRLAGFEDYKGNPFELIVTIFIDLAIDQQAEIFSTINSQQTRVDPSLNISLELDDKYFTPRKMMVEIAQSCNYDKESPWYNSIRMLGNTDKGIISLAAFARPLFDLTYPERDWYLIKNALTKSDTSERLNDFDYDMRRHLFWPFYIKEDSASVYKILNNFFSAAKSIFVNDWLNPESILNKTTGYNALIRLFKDIVPIGIKNKKFTYDLFFEIMKPLKELDGSTTAANYGSSGAYATNQLYRDFYELLKDRLI